MHKSTVGLLIVALAAMCMGCGKKPQDYNVANEEDVRAFVGDDFKPLEGSTAEAVNSVESTVLVTDEEDNPIAGVVLVIKSGSKCITQMTNSDGKLVINQSESIYDVTVQVQPDDYVKPEGSYTLNNGECLTIVLMKE